MTEGLIPGRQLYRSCTEIEQALDGRRWPSGGSIHSFLPQKVLRSWANPPDKFVSRSAPKLDLLRTERQLRTVSATLGIERLFMRRTRVKLGVCVTWKNVFLRCIVAAQEVHL